MKSHTFSFFNLISILVDKTPHLLSLGTIGCDKSNDKVVFDEEDVGLVMDTKTSFAEISILQFSGFKFLIKTEMVTNESV